MNAVTNSIRANDIEPIAVPSGLRGGKPKLVVFSGNTRRPSKSRLLAGAIAEEVLRRVEVEIKTIDLSELGDTSLAGWDSGKVGEPLKAIVRAIEEADALIAVTPVYKGSYTGLFKHVIDGVNPEALNGKPVIIGATGGGFRHALVVEHQLRPLFGFFNAQIAGAAVYASDGELVDPDITDVALVSRIRLAAEQIVPLLEHQFTKSAAFQA
ncbi:NAD(P)H-dependent oxidoreductase [Georhizobium sp. MAB10]|uniref:NAD(P)H-dependent oxidoreductase n=1 Tax=Georhizobium sp. MAB10 TaxID=3028319 RepID=UPI0038556B18